MEGPGLKSPGLSVSLLHLIFKVWKRKIMQTAISAVQGSLVAGDERMN